MSIVLQGSTSGSVTLQEPAVAGTTVLTLPAVSGTILTTASSGQSIPKAALPTGSVLQVVSATYSTQVLNSTTTYTDTGLSASITPTSSSSKILVIVSQTAYKDGSNAGSSCMIKLFRGSTDLGIQAYSVGYTNATGTNAGMATFVYLDSPATTSSTTYKTQFANGVSASQVAVNWAGSNSNIVLLEIAA
jgi:hypothetical protein